MENTLDKYINAFAKLKRGQTPFGVAPHKPILLLTVLQLFEKGLISGNKIYINSDLVGYFKENWLNLVLTGHQADFTQPFYFLQHDKAEGQQFWFLQPNLGYSIHAPIKSVKILSLVCAYAYLADDLFVLMQNTSANAKLQYRLLEIYFPGQLPKFNWAGQDYLHHMEDYVLNEPTSKIKSIEYTEEDVFVRSRLFKKWVPRLYNRSCAFTGMQLESTYSHNFIDACHIVPFSLSQNDKVTNGIALCPNMHRAFDRGLLSVSNQYTILVSAQVIEAGNHPYSLKPLQGKRIILPQQLSAQPSLENLAWHRENIFKP